MKLLDDEELARDRATRTEIVGVLANIGPAAADGLPALVKILHGPDPSLAVRAAVAIWRSHDRRYNLRRADELATKLATEFLAEV